MDGFVQTGWVDKETGAAYRLGDTYTENADVTLNPVFEKNHHPDRALHHHGGVE